MRIPSRSFTLRILAVAATCCATRALCSGSPTPKVRFMSAEFVQSLCTAYNQTSLPNDLGRKSSGWIDSMNSKGAQTVVMRRGDCSELPPIKVEMVADADGNAICKGTSLFKDGDKYTWKLAPDTDQWASFADGFGMLDMPRIFTKFEGDTILATNLVGAFEVLFATAGYLAQTEHVNWDCAGIDMAEVKETIKNMDQEKTLGILKGMPLLHAH